MHPSGCCWITVTAGDKTRERPRSGHRNCRVLPTPPACCLSLPTVARSRGVWTVQTALSPVGSGLCLKGLVPLWGNKTVESNIFRHKIIPVLDHHVFGGGPFGMALAPLDVVPVGQVAPAPELDCYPHRFYRCEIVLPPYRRAFLRKFHFLFFGFGEESPTRPYGLSGKYLSVGRNQDGP